MAKYSELTEQVKETRLRKKTIYAEITPECKCPTCKHLAFNRMFTRTDSEILEQTGLDVYSLAMMDNWTRKHPNMKPDCSYIQGHESFSFVNIETMIEQSGSIVKCLDCDHYMSHIDLERWFKREKRTIDRENAYVFVNGRLEKRQVRLR